MAETFLKIQGLHRHFFENRVLDGIDLEIERGKVTTIIGKSGMGKSVLLKSIAGIVEPDAGRIELDGRPIGVSRRKATAEEGVRFSYMFQGNALFDSLTAYENVAMPLRESGGLKRSEIDTKVRDLLEQLDLTDAAKRYPGELSGGMQKRVAFARALVIDPDLVLFDEPTTGLDPERKFGVFELIAEYREHYGFTAVLVSHDIPEVFKISDAVALLDRGKIRFFGEPAALEMSASPDVIEFLQRANVGHAKGSKMMETEV
ncbi:MAG: ATP-binding cassette domain-containing protein [Verrucomicrobiota bacterium]